MLDTVNVLFTSVGRRVELMRAFRAAYQKLDMKGEIIGIDIDPLAPALREVHKAIIVPRNSDPNYIPTLIALCQRHNVTTIFPLIDPDIPILAQHRNAIEAAGSRLAVVPQTSISTVNDKWVTTQFFQNLGLETPKTWLPEHLPPHTQIEYPLFIKPRDGSAGKNGFKITNHRELDFFLDYVPNPIVQEFISGPEITHDVVVGLNSLSSPQGLCRIISRRRIEVRSGEVSKGVTVYEPRMVSACQLIAKALPAIGPITVQCFLDERTSSNSRLLFTEINARMGGGLPLAIAAGVDVPSLLLQDLSGQEFPAQDEIPIQSPYRVSLFTSRFDDAYYSGQEMLNKIERFSA